MINHGNHIVETLVETINRTRKLGIDAAVLTIHLFAEIVATHLPKNTVSFF